MASNKRQKLQPENGACCECVCHGKSDEDDAAQSNVYKMQLQRYEIFKSQDGEKGHFDVTFMVGGKKIFANKHVLASISEPLNTMLSNRWFKNEDSVVEIKTCHYAGFHQFLCFVYSGKCMVTEENVFQLIDLAQSYDFCILKNFCDTFLSNIEYNVRKAYKMLEVSQTYSLKQCTESLKIYVEKNWKEVIDFDKFLLLEKSSVVLLSSFKRASNEEESFQNAVFKWAEHQGLVKQKAKNDESFNLDDAIKAELTDILPLLLLNNVNAEATQKFINKHRDWFSASESYQILRQSKDSKENIFKAIYHFAENEADKKSTVNENFNVEDAIKTELKEIIFETDFDKMDFEFVKTFLVDKRFLFSSTSKLYSILLNFNSGNPPKYDEVFEAIYLLAKSEASEKQNNISSDKNFSLEGAIKAELRDIIWKFKFDKVKCDYAITLAVEKAFLFSFRQLYGILLGCERHSDRENEIFQVAYQLAVAKSREEANAKEELFFESVINSKLEELFSRMKLKLKFDFVLKFIADKKFDISTKNLCKILWKSKGRSEEELFNAVYQLAEDKANKRKSDDSTNLYTNPWHDEEFNFNDTVKFELDEVMHMFTFSKMSFEFVQKIVAEKGFLFSYTEMHKILAECQRQSFQEEEVFKAIYKLAEAEATEKQKSVNNKHYNMDDIIRLRLFKALQSFDVKKLGQKFLLDFLVPKGLILYDEAMQLSNIRVSIRNGIRGQQYPLKFEQCYGTFFDEYGIYDRIGGMDYLANNHPFEQNLQIYCNFPKTPSAVKKVKDVPWYLCINKDGRLFLKEARMIKKTDYLLTPLRSEGQFWLAHNSTTSFRATRC